MNNEIINNTIVSQFPVPLNYPIFSTPDKFSTQPQSLDYYQRRKTYLDFIIQNPAPTNTKAPWYELARLDAGGMPHHGILIAALDYIDARKDNADIPLHCILRMIYQFSGDNRLVEELISRAQQTILGFRYWPDEPGQDSMQTWTENHYILFTSAAYLAGQLFQDKIFPNSGQTGEQKMALNRPRLLRWMNLRYFTGFCEWLSHVSYDEDLTALLSLVDFCEDQEIQQRATVLIDMLLLEMAINNYKGIFASCHGRSYENNKKWAGQECTTDTQKLLFGRGIFTVEDNTSAIAFVLSKKYRMPRVIFDISNDQDRSELLHRQRIGIRLDQFSWWDLKPNNFENGMHLLSQGAHLHYRVIKLFVRMMDDFNWWSNPSFSAFAEHRRKIKFWKFIGLLPTLSRRYERDFCRTSCDEVNVYTYRTPDYMISSAQDYKAGYGGDQQHIWQASLGPNAVCFTTQPARMHGTPPNYWTGSGILPRVAQIKNVVVVIYRTSKIPSLLVSNELEFTHAWFPKDQFDEVVEKDGWIFGKLGNGYIALLSQYPYEWHELPGEDQNREVIVRNRNNIWLCEMGRKEIDGDFSVFMQKLLQSEIKFRDSSVTYQSPSQGIIQFSWKGELIQDDRRIDLREYPRFASPYVQAPFPSETINIKLREESLEINWLDNERNTSSYIN